MKMKVSQLKSCLECVLLKVFFSANQQKDADPWRKEWRQNLMFVGGAIVRIFPSKTRFGGFCSRSDLYKA